MKSPLDSRRLWTLDEAPSTQDVAATAILDLDPLSWPGAILAKMQTAGRGRLGREWLSQAGASLTVSYVFLDYLDWPQPWLIGMTLAVATAEALDLELQWPNDLVMNGRKVGGILTELHADRDGRRVPIVGLGLNLAPESIGPDVAPFAGSIYPTIERVPALETIVQGVAVQLGDLPEPIEWGQLAERWLFRDQTPGKRFILPNGQVAIAERIGRQGELLARVEGQLQTVLAADAAWGLPAEEC